MVEREFVNRTPFAARELYLADEEFRDLLVLVVKATYSIGPAGLSLAEEQTPIDATGSYNGKEDPALSSVRYEAEIAPLKLSTDVVLLGHAYPDRAGTGAVDVVFEAGPLAKVVRVFGNRWWYRGLGMAGMTEPEPIERVPLIYEHAFGGWDRTPENPDHHTVEPRNPSGVGFHSRSGNFVEGAPLPNLEDPRQPIQDYQATPTPAGFGFIAPHWEPRASLAGTYDQLWVDTRMPLLPKDFNRWYFNAAPRDQIAPAPFRGDEWVRVTNASPRGQLLFQLPAEPPPICSITMRDATRHESPAALDTVIVDTDASRVVLLWRTHYVLPAGKLYDVRAIQVEPHRHSRHWVAPPPPEDDEDPEPELEEEELVGVDDLN